MGPLNLQIHREPNRTIEESLDELWWLGRSKSDVQPLKCAVSFWLPVEQKIIKRQGRGQVVSFFYPDKFASKQGAQTLSVPNSLDLGTDLLLADATR